MNVFRIFRRTVWGLILAGCIVVSCLYLAFSQVFLTSSGLSQVVQESGLVATIRNTIILPRITTLAQSTPYAGLLDDKTVTDAFNATVTDDMLSAKLTPAIDSVASWLNSKEPTVDFSINLTDFSDKFADELNSRVTAKIAALPQCRPGNTADDVQSGKCQSSLLNSDMITGEIDGAIKNNSAFGESVTITPATIPLYTSEFPAGVSLPSYLNAFYSATLVLAGLGFLITLWLLLKHRLGGIITIGATMAFAALILSIAATALTQAYRDSINPIYAQVARSGLQTFTEILQQQALLLAISGVATITLASIPLVILARRRKSHNALKMNSHSSSHKESKQ